MKDLFSKAFLRSLNEAVDSDVEDMSDADAMASTLDVGTNPTDFDVNAGVRQASLAAAKANLQMVELLRTWITRIEDFTKFLNSADPDSVQSTLSQAADKTLFGTIKTAETKKIAIVAKELSGLNEMLKGYLASSADPKYRGV